MILDRTKSYIYIYIYDQIVIIIKQSSAVNVLPCQPFFCQGALPTEVGAGEGLGSKVAGVPGTGFDVGDKVEREQLSPSLMHDSHLEPVKPHVIKQASFFLQ